MSRRPPRRVAAPARAGAPPAGAVAAALAVASAALALGCGSRSPDLFSVQRSGTVPGAQLVLVVSDGGTARCNGGPPRRITDPELLAARALERDLDQPATNGVDLPPGPTSVLTYAVQTSAGRVRFSDTSRGITPAFQRLAAFVHELAQRVCHQAL